LSLLSSNLLRDNPGALVSESAGFQLAKQFRLDDYALRAVRCVRLMK